MLWIDRYSGKTFRITTKGPHGPNFARVQTYGDVIESYEYHPEAKFADARGEPCGRASLGLSSVGMSESACSRTLARSQTA
jgi:hypothetical protein